MSAKAITAAFQNAGARASLRRFKQHSVPEVHRPMSIDIASDELGEYFDIRVAKGVGLRTVDVQPQDRHLLLEAWNWSGRDSFLCGHDEFHWFVAALPDRFGRIGNVDEARTALTNATQRGGNASIKEAAEQMLAELP